MTYRPLPLRWGPLPPAARCDSINQSDTNKPPPTPMTTTCLIAWAAILLILPIVILLNITSTQGQRMQRLRSYGWTQQRIADRFGLSRTTVRRRLTAALS